MTSASTVWTHGRWAPYCRGREAATPSPSGTVPEMATSHVRVRSAARATLVACLQGRLGALVVRGHQPQRRRRVGPGAQELGPCNVRVRLLVLAFREYVAEDVHEGCRRVVRRPPRWGG